MAISPDFSSAGPLGQLLEQIVNMLGQKGFGETTPYQNDILARMKQMFVNPLGSGIFKGLVGSVLNALRPSEALATQNLTDMFRAAGSGGSPLQSGAFAKQAQLLQGNILGNRSTAVANLAQNSMGQLLAALQGGFQMGDVNRLAPQMTVQDLLAALSGGINLSGAQARAQSGSYGGSYGGGSPSLGGFSPTSQATEQQAYQQLFGYQPTTIGYGAGNDYYTGGSPTAAGGVPITGPGTPWDRILQALGQGPYSGPYFDPNQTADISWSGYGM